MTDLPFLPFEIEPLTYHEDGFPHRRHYKIADITIQVESELAITDQTFAPKFSRFQTNGPGDETVVIHHRFGLPSLQGYDLGQLVYRQMPWAIYQTKSSWIYLGISSNTESPQVFQVGVLSGDHSRARIYHGESYRQSYLAGNCASLTLFPSDQILLGRYLAEHAGCFFHSAGAILDGRGMLFVGHSQAGKSTLVKMLQGRAEILCDERNIVRATDGAFKVHGTWSHGEIPMVSPNSAGHCPARERWCRIGP